MTRVPHTRSKSRRRKKATAGPAAKPRKRRRRITPKQNSEKAFHTKCVKRLWSKWRQRDVDFCADVRPYMRLRPTPGKRYGHHMPVDIVVRHPFRKNGVIIFWSLYIELKVKKNKPRGDQRRFLANRLRRGDCLVAVLYTYGQFCHLLERYLSPTTTTAAELQALCFPGLTTRDYILDEPVPVVAPPAPPPHIIDVSDTPYEYDDDDDGNCSEYEYDGDDGCDGMMG